ncbi:disease resistance protein At4g27190-like [Lycium ferocissimum]|uniref:disease resistance protein At4g27190-like n=1 Tax=Lycium ferocissimum TaxID=112874 RepID=UPI0028153B5B|nr:disease resistance protein At4g27190-like [Lycium ferocissimum]
MEILFNVASGFVVEVGKCTCRCIYPKIEDAVHFSSNIENLRKKMDKLTKYRDDIKGEVEGAKEEGYKPKPDVLKWIEDVHTLENDWVSMQDRIAAECCPKCSLLSEVSTKVQNIQDQICTLINKRESFGSNLVVENYQMRRVEFIPGPSLEGQSAATKNLNKILQLLEDDKICIIGVWGAAGVGKTILVKNLNNELRNTAPSSKLFFGVVIWVTIPKPPTYIRDVQAQVAKQPTEIRGDVQAQIAKRLNLEVDDKGSVESIAGKIYQRLKQEKSFLLILDDVWEDINLVDVGVPQPEDAGRSKVILTSRFLNVCTQMKSNIQLKIDTLDEDESWQLFVKHAGDNANLEHIRPLAKKLARECDGLPLAITTIGQSMRGKMKVELWKDALKSLSISEPHKDVENKVYQVIKLSFNYLVSQDIESSSEQRSKHVKKRRGDIQSCFLYCSLYPAAIPQDDIIHSWWAEGFLGEHDTYDEAYNRGITTIESLKGACLLEDHEMDEMDSVKMHDVVRDVARWIANSSGNEHNSLIRAGNGLTDISHIKMSASVKRISFISNKIDRVPDSFMECPETTTLLLQDNHLENIPRDFFLAFPNLRVLNLSGTGIRALPSSINSLYQLHALILGSCRALKQLQPLGDLCNLHVLDCNNTELCRLPRGMDKLKNLRLLNLPAASLKSIKRGFFLNLSSIEMLNMTETESNFLHTWVSEILLGPTSFDEISSLHNLTSLFIKLDRSSIGNRDYTWMTRLKNFRIEVGRYKMPIKSKKSEKTIRVSQCENFSNGELSGMLKFASDLYLVECSGLRKLFAYNSLDGLKSLYIYDCYCDFEPAEEGSGQIDPFPNLEDLKLSHVDRLNSVSDFCHHLGLRFSKLRRLDINSCDSLTCLFNVGGAFSVPKHLEEITINCCDQLVELFVQCGSSQTTLVNLEIPRVRKLKLRLPPKLGTLGEPQSMWEHIQELILEGPNQIRKLPLSIQTSENIKVIRGTSKWWSQLEWDDDNFKSNLERCFIESLW